MSYSCDILFHFADNQIGQLSITDPNKDDFELWSPSEEREERCLFGRQVLYLFQNTHLDVLTRYLIDLISSSDPGS